MAVRPEMLQSTPEASSGRSEEKRSFPFKASLYELPFVTNQELIGDAHIPTNNGFLTPEGIKKTVGIDRRAIHPKAKEIRFLLDQQLLSLESASHRTAEVAHDMLLAACQPLTTDLKKIKALYVIETIPSGDTATLLNNTLGLSVPEEDRYNVHAACSGFGRALRHLHEKRLDLKHEIVAFAAVELYSPWLFNLQKMTSRAEDPYYLQTIFSDAAGVIILNGKTVHILATAFSENFTPEERQSFKVPVNLDLIQGRTLHGDILQSEGTFIQMNGPVLGNALKREIPKTTGAAFQKAGIYPHAYRQIIPIYTHLGSQPILDAQQEELQKLGYSFAVEMHGMNEGNLSSVSIIKQMILAAMEGRFPIGKPFGINTFGAGPYVESAVLVMDYQPGLPE